MNLHDMMINAKEHSEHLYEALDMFHQSIQLRSEAFAEIGKETAHFLVTVCGHLACTDTCNTVA